jgi:hypothetical protein
VNARARVLLLLAAVLTMLAVSVGLCVDARADTAAHVTVIQDAHVVRPMEGQTATWSIRSHRELTAARWAVRFHGDLVTYQEAEYTTPGHSSGFTWLGEGQHHTGQSGLALPGRYRVHAVLTATNGDTYQVTRFIMVRGTC